ncbi:MAG: site-2 protease family protein [Planctomycetota bacterium]
MTEQEKKLQQDSTQEQNPQKNETRQLVIFAIILGVLAVWGVRNPGPALRILAVLLGFGGIVMIHELGHFLVAKLGGIKVEAFSIGMGPVVLGIRKLKTGWRVRVLPKIGEEQVVEEGDNETEYQIALLPIGGFVKMLGQSDTGAADESKDPRSYSNRPVGVRIATVSAGVVFNAIGAIIIFMILFMNGIDLKPAVVGKVLPNSPAYDVGLRWGDQIVEVNGERFVDFESVLLAPALSKPGETISYIVAREDGTEEEFEVIAEKKDGDESSLRYTGITPETTLTVTKFIKAPNKVQQLYANSGLRPGDVVMALNGQAVQTPSDYAELESQTFQKEISLRVLREWNLESGQETMEDVSFPVWVAPKVENFRDAQDLAHFCSLVPRLKVADDGKSSETAKSKSLPAKVLSWIKTTIFRRGNGTGAEAQMPLNTGDIIIKVADVDFPNYKQLRELTTEHKDKDLAITVLRKSDEGIEERLDFIVRPKSHLGSDRVTIGFAPELDMDSPIVAQVLVASGQAPLPNIPAGAMITSVDGRSVSSFYEIATLLQDNAGDKVGIDYLHKGQAGGTAVVIPEHEPIHAQAAVAVGIPFEDKTEEFQYSNPVQATQMGLKKTWQFIWRSYVTLGRLFQRSVPMSALSGPVGIISMTYKVAGTTASHYFYFLGLISSCLAVMNLLPLPVLDGGHIVILLIEKFSGKPINERILAGAMYAGLAFLLGLVLLITYFDLIRMFGK